MSASSRRARPARAPARAARARAAVSGSSRSIRVMCFTPDQPSAAARARWPRGGRPARRPSRPAGAVDREVRAVQRGQVARRGEARQWLGRGQNAVARGQRRRQRPEELVPVLGGQHGPGAVVRRQDQRRGGAGRWVPSSAPASASTTLATAEKSSRPYPAALAAVSSRRARPSSARARRSAPRRPWRGRGPWP